MGEGKFSKVVEAFDRVERKTVAIKIVRAVQRYTESARIEVEILEAVRKRDAATGHGSLVVGFGGSFEWKGHVCILFEHCGISIYDFLVHNRYIPFSIDDIRDIGRQLVHSLCCPSPPLSLSHTHTTPPLSLSNHFPCGEGVLSHPRNGTYPHRLETREPDVRESRVPRRAAES